MTEHAGYPDTDTKPDLMPHNVGDTGSALPNNKRKRPSHDQGGTPTRPAPGDSSRSPNSYSRVSPGTSNSASGGANDLLESTAAHFLTTHNASNDESGGSMDFGISGGLGGHAGDHGLHQNGGSNNADTAAAALAHYTIIGDHTVQPQHHGLPDFSNLDSHSHSLKPNSQQSQSSVPTAQSSGGAVTSGDSANDSPTQPSHKPPVGSEEWHKVRRDNHKEVERRRRETINEGINELAKIVPGCEKNKGSILQRAVQFITQLKENEQQNLEKWTLEKLLTEQAISELSTSVDKFKVELQRVYEEMEIWKRACQNAGIVPDEFKDQNDASNQNGDS